VDQLNAQDDLLEYYRRELTYLRVQGAEFAQRHPKVARRLALTGGESLDPHTERLIEAVAFLGARIHRSLDAEFPRVASALLEGVCPNLAQGIPSMTIVRFALNATQGRVTSGYRVPRGAMLLAQAAGVTCRFRVTADTVLWPLTVSQARLHDTRTLKLEFEAAPGYDLSELELDQLRLHLSGEALSVMPLHEMLLGDLESIELRPGGGGVRALPLTALQEVGFDEDQEALLRPTHAHPAYGLLQEYFAFPRKFQFFDITGLRGRLGRGRHFELRLTFSRSARALSTARAETFQLGCVPVINLFQKSSEPIVLDQRRLEYRLVADLRNEDNTEVHAISEVIASDPAEDRPQRIPHAFGGVQSSGEDEPQTDLSWVAHRVAALRPDISGTDTYLSFIDRRDVRRVPREPVIFAELWCTNRRLAEQVPPGARLVGQGLSGELSITTLYEPSAQREPVLSARAMWHLVSMLRLNHSSLANGPQALAVLQQLLMMFAGDSAREQAQVRGISALSATPALAPVAQGRWRGHGRGTDVQLSFNEDAFAGSSPLLFASVLARFLALYTTANSFVRLSVLQGSELRRRWPAMSGRQCLL